MSIQLVRSSLFEKDYAKLQIGIKLRVDERLILFATNEFAPILNNHKLKYDYEGFRSINVTGDWRIIFRKLNEGYALLHRVGTHHQLFGK